jgi:hypothetical protein
MRSPRVVRSKHLDFGAPCNERLICVRDLDVPFAINWYHSVLCVNNHNLITTRISRQGAQVLYHELCMIHGKPILKTRQCRLF